MVCLKSDSTCCICLDSTFLRFDCRRCKVCKQYTHRECFRKWSSHSPTHKCPTCRYVHCKKQSPLRRWIETQKDSRKRRITIHEFLKESNRPLTYQSRWKQVLSKIRYRIRLKKKNKQHESIYDEDETVGSE